MFNSIGVRTDFPILSREVNGKPLTYLDSAATSQKPEAVLQAMDDFYRQHNANPHRGLHTLGEEATAAYEEARKSVAEFISAEPKQLIFTRSATEALNLFVGGWASHNVKKGDVIVLTEMEHHANLVPWYILSEEYELEFRFVGLTKEGHLDLEDLREKVKGAKAVGVTAVSNVLGTVNPIREIGVIAHEAGAAVLVDAAQAAPHLPLDVATWGADAVALTGHKMLGPTGIGALWVAADRLTEMSPVYGGGEMIKTVGFGQYEPAEPPHKFEAGTMPVAEAVGWAAAVRYLDKLGMAEVREHEISLNRYALETLAGINGLKMYGPSDSEARGGLVAFTIDGVHAHDLATILDQEGIAIRSGHHCAEPLHRKLGIPASARASWSVYTTEADIDRLVAGIKKAQKVFA